MQVLSIVSEIKQQVQNAGSTGKIVGLVPTMGALHEGHISLIKRARSECDLVVVSIFVNPTQFNDKNDFKNYPRNVEADLDLLRNAGCDIAFVPEYAEVYPEPDHTVYDFGSIESRFEGAHRPGHFRGVGMVVKRFFEIVTPDKAYFGLKDYQQVMIIRSLVKQFNLNVEVIAAPTMRENDGLAMSSRNQLLTDKQREAAPLIFRVLKQVQKEAPHKRTDQVVEWAKHEINQSPELEVEYFDIAHPETLEPLKDQTLSPPAIALVAVRAGKVRLIDNLELF